MGEDLVVFAVGSWRLALPRTVVRELVHAVAITELPGAPDGVEGVIDLRGEVLPVYDLTTRLGGAARPIRASDHMLICDVGARGAVVVRSDRVLGLRATNEVLQSIDANPVVAGVVALPDGVVAICDLAVFLSDGDAEKVASALDGIQP